MCEIGFGSDPVRTRPCIPSRCLAPCERPRSPAPRVEWCWLRWRAILMLVLSAQGGAAGQLHVSLNDPANKHEGTAPNREPRTVTEPDRTGPKPGT
eukprot:9486535-Pyramimonas_sp.AAC.1